jgi:hypothetical protein
VKRPKLITTVCIIGYLTVLLTFPQVFSPSIKKLGIFMPAIYGVLVASHFMACVGIWHFKQWGAQLYVITFFAKIVFFLLISQLSFGFYFGSLISLLSVFVLLPHYRNMNSNL